MTSIYAVLQTLLPFEWAGHHFMLNAFLAILLVTPLFGLLSTMVVSNRMAFFSEKSPVRSGQPPGDFSYYNNSTAFPAER